MPQCLGFCAIPIASIVEAGFRIRILYLFDAQRHFNSCTGYAQRTVHSMVSIHGERNKE